MQRICINLVTFQSDGFLFLSLHKTELYVMNGQLNN